MALGLAALGAPILAMAADHPVAPARPDPHRIQQQRARLPKRLAADFRDHIESRLPPLRPSFEAASRETGLNWHMLAALAYQESRWLPAAVSPRGAQLGRSRARERRAAFDAR